MKLTFAEHLRDFRIEKKMSLRELADLLDVSHTLIGLIETNKRRASSKFIRKFAKYSEKTSNCSNLSLIRCRSLISRASMKVKVPLIS